MSVYFSFKEREISSDAVEGKILTAKIAGHNPAHTRLLKNARRRNPHHKNNARILFVNHNVSYASTTMGKNAIIRIAP